jgi:soluble lytic murein transglycosylase
MFLKLRSRQLGRLWLVLGACLVLVGCADAPPTPTPWLPTASATTLVTAQATVQATAQARTSTRTPEPAPSSTPTPTLTPSPTFTPSPTATPTWTPTMTPTPSPTPLPSAQLEAARRHQINGDYDQAIAAYQALLDDDPTPEQARQARYHLAEAYSLNREYAAAAAAWESFIADYPEDGRLPQARLMAARAYQAVNQCVEAIALYEAYLADETPLADMVYEWMGDCHAADQQPESAIAAYRKALEATRDRGVQVGLREKIAGASLALEDYDATLAEYDAILDIARIEDYRARIEYQAGQVLSFAGQTEAAHARYRRAVDNYPEAEYAYLSLIELVNAGVEVDEFQRGLVDYYAGTIYPDAYGAALRAFDRYLEADPAARADEALYYKALSQRALDQPEAALESLEALVVGYPESKQLPRAWMAKATTLARMSEDDRAVKAYQDLAAFFPADELAPKALWQAAKLREGAGVLDEAAKLHEDVQAAFPAFENADEALWRAGLAHYLMDNRERAVADWQALLDKYPTSPYRPKTLYWLGKLEAADGAQEESGYWDRLVAAVPGTYYALRVEQTRSADSLTSTRLITAAVEPPPWDAAEAEAQILPWLRGWTLVPTDTNLITLPVTLTQRLDFRRGEALLAVGLRSEALDAFDAVRSAAWDDPVALAQLSLHFREQGLHGLAARTASRLAGLWPEGDIQGAPLALQRLAYPLVYADLLSAEAQEQDLDPLLLAALIRQESLFEPVAESYAGARGLGQVMPATGEGIARNLDMDDFVLDDLYRPWVSIRFAAYYLGLQMGRFDDQILIALAAYNGGPGNTLRWLEAGGDDLDLFVEVITATQSRLYLQRVYEQYLIYEALYRPAGIQEP